MGGFTLCSFILFVVVHFCGFSVIFMAAIETAQFKVQYLQKHLYCFCVHDVQGTLLKPTYISTYTKLVYTHEF